MSLLLVAGVCSVESVGQIIHVSIFNIHTAARSHCGNAKILINAKCVFYTKSDKRKIKSVVEVETIKQSS